MSGGLKLLIIDPQNDFCCNDENPLPNGNPGSLCVPGAWDDMNVRLPRMIDELGPRIKGISVTLDCHQVMHIANPFFWKNAATGDPPSPFTIIDHDDVKQGIYVPAVPSLREHALRYTQQLEQNGRYKLCIWPEHCIIGTAGNAIVPGLAEALNKWARDNRKTVSYVSKGSFWGSEHYSGIKADVPDPRDPSTQVNTALIRELEEAAELLIAGEASSHCVLNTVNDTMTELGEDAARTWTLLEDCMSGIPSARDGSGNLVPGTPDFDEMVAKFMRDHQQRGGRIAQSGDIIARYVA